MALSVATEFIGEVEIDGRLKIKGEEKVFSNHTHVALSFSQSCSWNRLTSAKYYPQACPMVVSANRQTGFGVFF